MECGHPSLNAISILCDECRGQWSSMLSVSAYLHDQQQLHRSQQGMKWWPWLLPGHRDSACVLAFTEARCCPASGVQASWRSSDQSHWGSCRSRPPLRPRRPPSQHPIPLPPRQTLLKPSLSANTMAFQLTWCPHSPLVKLLREPTATAAHCPVCGYLPSSRLQCERLLMLLARSSSADPSLRADGDLA